MSFNYEQEALKKLKNNISKEEHVAIIKDFCNQQNQTFSQTMQDLKNLEKQRKQEYAILKKLTQSEKRQYYVNTYKEINEFIAKNKLNAVLIESNNLKGGKNE
jgi:hypothetical protein